LYYITDRKQLPGGELLYRVHRAVEWGVDFVQIREKDLCDRDLFDLTARVLKAAEGTNCRVLVNGRADVALAAGAQGVHLPAQGISPAALRARLPRGFLIGGSAHSIREARRTASSGADYVLFGPVFRTESKIPFGPPLGLACLRRACAAAPIPVIALGGIHPELVLSVLRSGAAGIAGISMFQQDIPRRRLTRARLLSGGIARS
jgi:thiamine-phosphate pyrophosphorylase